MIPLLKFAISTEKNWQCSNCNKTTGEKFRWLNSNKFYRFTNSR
jgi:hypothetical protein